VPENPIGAYRAGSTAPQVAALAREAPLPPIHPARGRHGRNDRFERGRSHVQGLGRGDFDRSACALPRWPDRAATRVRAIASGQGARMPQDPPHQRAAGIRRRSIRTGQFRV